MSAPASIVWAMYLAAAEKRGIALDRLGGTIQNDALKEYIAQREWIVPVKPAMKLVVDTFRFGSREVPRWNTISISGYHIREAGATALQELAFTLIDGLEYVKWGVEAGLDVDDFVPHLSFFFDVHNDFFEEIAKFRAARRIWAPEIEQRYHRRSPRSLLLRTHAQTAGVSLTAQQPYNNIVRVALQALAAVLGGTQSLHTNALDEALALPTEEAARTALRTQQIIAHETGVTDTSDPLGGSYYLETLTDALEQRVYEYFRKLDELGGMMRAIELGFPQHEISEAAYRTQQRLDKKEDIIVGVNDFVAGETPLEILKIDPRIEQQQITRVQHLRQVRDNALLRQRLAVLESVAKSAENIMPAILDAIRAYGTIGEIADVLRGVWGTYEEESFALS